MALLAPTPVLVQHATLLDGRRFAALSARGASVSCRAAAELPVYSLSGVYWRLPSPPRRASVVPRAAGKSDRNSFSASDFNLPDYLEARVETVKNTEKYGNAVFLRLLDPAGSVLPIYVGEAESTALLNQLHRRPTGRPLTQDLMRNIMEVLGSRVTKVRITELLGNTYHARVHFSKGVDQSGRATPELDIDARASDAMNLALRFGAPIYIHREVAAKMARPMSVYEERHESQSEIVRSCREAVLQFNDPTVMHKLNLQLAIAEERYDDAAGIRNVIEKLLSSDRLLSLVVAMETALSDARFEEAAKLRDEFNQLQSARLLQEAQE